MITGYTPLSNLHRRQTRRPLLRSRVRHARFRIPKRNTGRRPAQGIQVQKLLIWEDGGFEFQGEGLALLKAVKFYYTVDGPPRHTFVRIQSIAIDLDVGVEIVVPIPLGSTDSILPMPSAATLPFRSASVMKIHHLPTIQP